MRLNPTTHFVPGLSLKPSSALPDWLNHLGRKATGGRKRLRLPVVVRFQDAYRFAIGEARIGGPGPAPDGEPVYLALDDSGMGISLLSILQDLCPPQEMACAVWLEGLWGPLFEPDPAVEAGAPSDALGAAPSGEDARRGVPVAWPFAVLKVVGPVLEAAERVEGLWAFVEAEGSA